MNSPDLNSSPSPLVFGDAAGALAPLLEHVRDGCVFVDCDLRVGFLNGAARRDIVARADDPNRFVGESLWVLFDYPADAPERLAIERSARERVPVSFTTHGAYGADQIEADIAPVEQGTLIYYRDVTPRAASVAEAASNIDAADIETTSERLRVLIDEAPLAVIVVDTNLEVLLWNPAAETMFQWAADEIVGQQLPILPEDEGEGLEGLRKRLLSGVSVRAEPSRRRRKDGVILDVQVSNGPLRDREGNVIGTIGMISDVTANRKLEAQLRMSQKMEAVGLLAGGVAHDFNNLLTAIKGFTSLLQITLLDHDNATEYLGEINKAADRAAALTAQLLAFSRRQLLRPKSIDLNARVRDLERMLRFLLHDDGRLLLELDPDLNEVLADPGQVEQVILNLVINARDAIHGRDGSLVTISTSNVDLVDEFAQWGVLDAPGPYIRLDVVDNGIGMDRATLARIFDPFFTTKEAGQGTGLGLATVFGIVKQSGGYVWAESRPGVGSTFSVYLPRAKTPGRISDKTRAIESAGNERILLVEDEDAIRRMGRRALEQKGYQVIAAADGAAALALDDENEIDLLVTDVMMPGMLGTTLANEVRRRHPGIPVLFMSGHSAEIVRDGLLDPSTPFLAKPFTPPELLAKVREALDHARSVV